MAELKLGSTVNNELIATENDLSNLENKIITHEGRSDIHITNEEKEKWSSKSDFSGNYDDLKSIPTSFVPSGHNHNISDIAELQTALDSKATKAQLDVHSDNKSNPHQVTSEQVNHISSKLITDLPASYPIGVSIFGLSLNDSNTWRNIVDSTIKETAYGMVETVVGNVNGSKRIVQRITFVNYITSGNYGTYEREGYSSTWQPFKKVLNSSDIVDDLITVKDDKPLSANQGKVLNDKFNTHENKSDIHVTSSEKDTWNNKSNFSGSYEDLTNKPKTFTPSEHKHVISDVTNLQTALDSKLGSNDISNHLNGLGLVKTDGTTPMNNVTIGTRKGIIGLNSFAQGEEIEASEDYSHAEGSRTIASGDSSHAEGSRTVASGYASHAEGGYTTASEESSHAEGYSTEASGFASHSEGEDTIANGYASHAEGGNTTVTGDYSHAEGYRTEANGYASHAEGKESVASGDYSHAEGYYAKASGYASHAQGYYTESKNNSSHSAGRYSNMTLSSETVYSSTADAFVIGNGTSSSSRSNAFRVKFNGSAYGKSAYNSTGADYAEYFEWLDGNLENEDRVGYFVTIDGEKIRKASSTDNYILGIISANPSVIGDSHQEEWYDKYVRDVWGRIQYHYVDVEYEEEIIEYIEDIQDVTNDENRILIPITKTIKVIKSEYQPKLNPNWINEEEYIPREKRKEWSAVGMMGKLLVRDDGACKVNEYCKPNNNGIATYSESGYRVMKRIDDNIVQVMLI